MVRINSDKSNSAAPSKLKEIDAFLTSRLKAWESKPEIKSVSLQADMDALREIILRHENQFAKAVDDHIRNSGVDENFIDELIDNASIQITVEGD